MLFPGRQLLPPSLPSAPCSATQHRTNHRHTDTCTLGDRLDLPLKRGYRRSLEAGVKVTQQKREGQKTSWGALCFPLQAMGPLCLASVGLLGTLSISIITGLSKAHWSQGKHFHCFQWVMSFIRLGTKQLSWAGDSWLEVSAWAALGWCYEKDDGWHRGMKENQSWDCS